MTDMRRMPWVKRDMNMHHGQQGMAWQAVDVLAIGSTRSARMGQGLWALVCQETALEKTGQ
jgi:hypothetical protein